MNRSTTQAPQVHPHPHVIAVKNIQKTGDIIRQIDLRENLDHKPLAVCPSMDSGDSSKMFSHLILGIIVAFSRTTIKLIWFSCICTYII